jgi:RNA polymerase sigma-70 factor (ECF subfamily)
MGASTLRTPTRSKRASAAADLASIRPELLAYLQKRTGSRQAAEDLLQSAFLRCIETQAVRLPRDEKLIAWFYALLGNALVDLGRRRGAESRALQAFARQIDLHVGSDPDERRKVCLCIARLLEMLKPDYRRALCAVDVEDEPMRELARRERISNNNATVRLHRARRALARRVRSVCGSCADRHCTDCTCPQPLRTRS